MQQLDRQTFQDRFDEGKAAYQQGDPSDSCPYNRYGDAENQFGHRYWTRGWITARSAAESQPQRSAEASAGQ
ncbi:hypothetical protein ACFVFT_38140 [Streptomyces tendae]|uniref:hypothetical protein n=1 Tax=Streptomyces tendae TaxID=1932 RepID=UPI0036BF7062